VREAIDARSGHCHRSACRKLWTGLVLAAVAGCATPPWDADRLAARHPELRGHPGQRLADVRPYYWPQHDQLTLFLCRWSREEPIPVAISADATERERRAVHTALAAWEGAGLGVSFARVERLVGRGIEFEFVAGMLSWAASTVAECAVDGEPSAAPGAALDAGMVAASIQLGRNDPRLVGSVLHELGHALGFQGHPRRGDSIMLRDPKRLLATSVRVGRGGEFSDSTLAALYALPSGTVLARLALPTGRSAAVDRLAELARQHGWRGPLLQVGDNAARMGWHDADGAWVFVRISGLRAALDDPGKLVIEPGQSAERWLD
jgi:hypothetical protein